MTKYNKQVQVKEIIRCAKEPNYFFKNYVRIQHPIRGLIPFEMFPFQEDCVDEFLEHRFNIVVKSRQLGLSTLVAAYAVWMAIFQKEKNILIIATKLSVAQNFINKVKTMIKSLPSWMLLTEIVEDNKQKIKFSSGSEIKAVPTSEDAGRSEALSLLIVDEAAFVRNFDTIWTGIYPTISTGGRVIILSTPNGIGGQYHKLYVDAEAGLNEFNSINLPWSVHPERDNDWFEKTTKNLNKRQIAQEYLCDFAISGDTFLDVNSIEWLRTNIRPPAEKMGADRNVWVWKYPLTEHNYILSADVSRGDSKDYSTFHIIDTTTAEIVAEYKGKIKPDNFAELINEFGLKYCKALVCPENNSYGYATILKLQDLKYPKLYYRKKSQVYIGDYVPPSSAEIAGFNTNGKTRSTVLAKLEEVLRNRQLISYSSRFYEELKVFTWNTGRAEARSGFNDDLVMSLAIGAWILEGASEYSKGNTGLNEAMLAAMSRNQRTYNETPSQVLTPAGVYTSNPNKESLGKNVRQDLINTKSRSNIPQDLLWILK